MPPGPLTIRQVPGGAVDIGTHRLNGPASTAVSPDGRHVYVAAGGDDALLTFARARGGELRPVGCVSETGSAGRCADGFALDLPSSVAVSPDGAHVYVTSARGNAVVAFARDRETGETTEIGCVAENGAGGRCARGNALRLPLSVTVSPDGRNVYVASSFSGAVVALARDAGSGALRQVGCVSDQGSGDACADGNALEFAGSVAVSPDGRHVYAAAGLSNSIVTFARDGDSGLLTQSGCVSNREPGCARSRVLEGASSLTLSPDGRNLYVASTLSDAVGAFRRDAGDGSLHGIGCVNDDGDGPCSQGYALNGVSSLVASPDGRNVYAASGRFSHGIAVFRRQLGGGLSQVGCISQNGTQRACGVGRGLLGARSISISPDSRNLYVIAPQSDALSVFAPVVAIAGRSLKVSRTGVVRMTLVCPPVHLGRCAGRLRITAVRGRRRKSIGSRLYSVAPGTSRRVGLRLTPTGQRLLRARPRGLWIFPSFEPRRA